MTSDPAGEVRQLRPGDDRWLVPLFDECFGHHRPWPEWEWMYLHEHHRADTHVLLVDGTPKGFMGRLRFEAWVDGRRAVLGRGGDLMLDPSIRKQPVRHAIVQPTIDSGVGLDVSYSFPADHTIVATRRAGYTSNAFARIPQWVRWERGAALHDDRPGLPPLAASAVAGSLRLRGAFGWRPTRHDAHDVRPGDMDRWARGFDALADRSKDFAAMLVIRDAAFVRWRWHEHPTVDWAVLVASADGERVDGYIVFGLVDGRHEIVDLLVADESAMRLLVRRAVRSLRGHGAQRVLFELNDPRPWPAAVLRELGFLPRGVGPNFSASARADWVRSDPQSLSTWYITKGDTDHC